MNVTKSTFVLSIIFLTGIFNGCSNIKFQSNVKPEDEIIRLDKPGDAPKGKNQDYKIGDDVSVIANNGDFFVQRKIDQIGGKMIFAPEYHERGGIKKWLPVAGSTYQNTFIDNQDTGRTAPKGYRVVSGGRSNYYEWFPPEQIFPAPWANNVKLKVGDIVYQKSQGFNSMRKGVVSELPVESYDDFRVRFSENNISTEVRASEIFSSIAQAKPEDLLPGEIVYYNETTWAIVIGKRDDKIIIRQEQNSLGDIIVDISKLQILK